MSQVAHTTAEIPDPYSLALEDINVAQPSLFQNDAHWRYFERLRKEDPVHFCAESDYGPFWSVTKFNDILYVDSHHEIFSSQGGITLGPPVKQIEPESDFRPTMFIAMDPPKHDVQRATVTPVVAPRNLVKLEDTIRGRVAKILDSLPRGETFDWVDTVSVELTTQMLATLFDFPFEDRRKLTRWSDIVFAIPQPGGVVESQAQKRDEMMECVAYFSDLWEDRRNRPAGNDLVSMLVHGEATKHMAAKDHLGNLLLLIVGGNDTTRNTMSGSVYALNQFPDQYDKLIADPGLARKLAPEVIRWQTPLPYMRRTATRDCELAGKPIKKNDQLLLWYVSANRDEDVFPDPYTFDIGRDPNDHFAFGGFGEHFCLGAHLARWEMRAIFHALLPVLPKLELASEPELVAGSLHVGGIKRMFVRAAG